MLGNPLGLIRNLLSGFINIFDYSIQGFLLGSLEGLIGTFKGVYLFICILIDGICNTVSKISNTIANGLVSISLDKEYQIEREQYKLKNYNLFNGFYMALFYLIFSIYYALRCKPLVIRNLLPPLLFLQAERSGWNLPRHAHRLHRRVHHALLRRL